jgi:hypothetical protein
MTPSTVKLPVLMGASTVSLWFAERQNSGPPLEEFETKQDLLVEQLQRAPANSPGYKYRQVWEHNRNPFSWTPQSESYESTPNNLILPTRECTKLDRNINMHIFIDNSNITAGLPTSGKGIHPINPAALAEFLESGRPCVDKQLVGSFPHASHPIWKEWENLNYRCRITNQGKEQLVDDGLHAQIFRAILLYEKTAASTVLVIATGDGNNNNNYSNFVECVTEAAQRGFQVEICSWKSRLSKRYLQLAEKYPQIQIRYLDHEKSKLLML